MTSKKFSTLMYHGIHNNIDCSGNYDPVYSVSFEQFCFHLDWIEKHNFKAETLEYALNNPSIKSIVITFDDGDISNYLRAFPELVKRGMKAEFYITSDWINTNGYMTEEQLLEMSKAGMSIQAHGKTHSYMSDLELNALIIELSESKARISKITNIDVHTVALPGGRGLKKVLPIFENLGYKFIATSVLGESASEKIINRISISSNTSMQVLSSLVSKKGSIYYKCLLKQFVFNSAKSLLGNRIYDITRNLLLRD